MNGYEIFEQWMGDSNDAFAPLLSLGKITADTIESVARRNYNVAGDYFDLGLSQLKLLTAGNDVAKLGTEESRLAGTADRSSSRGRRLRSSRRPSRP